MRDCTHYVYDTVFRAWVVQFYSQRTNPVVVTIEVDEQPVELTHISADLPMEMSNAET